MSEWIIVKRASFLGRHVFRVCAVVLKNLSSEITWKLKIRLCILAVELVLLYGAKTRTQVKRFEQEIHGFYARMLRMTNE